MEIASSTGCNRQKQALQVAELTNVTRNVLVTLVNF
jgi:hypothetical protein